MTLLSFLEAPPMSARKWEGQPFIPAFAHTGRAMTVGLDDQCVTGQFLSEIPNWFSELSVGNKPVWDEAVGLANVIPDSVSSISSEDFVACFGRKAFGPLDPRRQLGTEALLPVPAKLCEEEFSLRKEFLSHLNVTAGVEALLLQQGSQDSAIGPLSAALKLSLPPLWSAFVNFAAKRLELRQRALQGCDLDGQQARRLLSSSPLSSDLFGQAEVDVLKEVALHQATSVSSVLSFNPPAKRPSSYSHSRGKGKRRKPDQGHPGQTSQGGRGKGRGR